MTSIEWNPGTLLELSGSYWKTCTLHAGVSMSIFTEIGRGQSAADEIARQLSADTRAVTMLLNALTALGLLQKSNDRYENTPSSLKYLSKDSPDYIGYMIMHHHHLVESWSRLHASVLTGKPVRTQSFDDPARREHFLMGMFNNARLIAPKLVTQIDLSGCRRLLDLGGGPGTYAIYFCIRNPDIHATVFDLPTSRPYAEKTIYDYLLTDRIDFMSGSYLEDPIEGTYDAVWMSHILHAENPDDCLNIIKKAVSVIEPGGKIMIHDFILNPSMDGPLFSALFSLNMLLGTQGGQSYSEKQITDMLADAGVRQIERHPFRGPTDSGIMIGRV